MKTDEAINSLLNAHSYFETQGSGYKNWGHVKVLQIALKISDTEFLLTDDSKDLKQLTQSDIQQTTSGPAIFRQIFSKRKRIGCVLITRQQYASQLQQEVPAILDDQAQLLGVSVRIAKSERDVINALSSRFAAIMPDGKSICIGATIEEAYVAAQLLEKTAKVFIEAKKIGGAVPINKIEAWLMQQYYQFKYSKEAVKNR
ncbi:MAG: L-fuculose phosphate aldolase [Bacteroidota bacterium]|nr:L-fuculose phosphate aldolase [Bacteroidota bacterium]